jgi:hypothetical protein
MRAPPGLQARSQEARANWETALDAKDRAIDQLEEALASRQRALVSARACVCCSQRTQTVPAGTPCAAGRPNHSRVWRLACMR